MSRAADYAIQGFLYQFNKTLLELLKAHEDDIVTIEGIIEDIEIAAPAGITAIQCKYHESSTAFNESAIYKPLLQMLKHFSANVSADIRYVLFAHFPEAQEAPPTVDAATLRAALKSKDKQLKKQIDAVPATVDLEGFLQRFELEIGPSYQTIVNQVMGKLAESAFGIGDVETLAYPNAIQNIAMLSVRHDSSKRNVTKKQFLSDLKAIHATAITRWTLAIGTRGKLLSARRRQQKVHLSQNSRLRYFLFEPDHIENYDAEIVIFIDEFVKKYHTKIAHVSTPVFCICADREHVQEIESRLYTKGIVAENGYIGGAFHEPRFFRDPMFSRTDRSKIKREFDIRILSWHDHAAVLNSRKADDLFVVGETDCTSLNTQDVNVERLTGVTMKELKFIMGLSDVAE